MNEFRQIGQSIFLLLQHFVGPKADYCPTQPLFWREYFYQLSYKNDKFDRVIGNPMSYQIRWDCMSQSPACKHAEFQAWSEVSN